MIHWGGVFPAVTTQFRRDQSLDLEGTARHVEALIESGCKRLGHARLAGREHRAGAGRETTRVELAVKVSARRVPVLSGVAECSTAAACRYARDMEKLGADGLMVLPAMVYKSDERETVAHFRAVARCSGLPVLCYNNPLAYGVDITPRMFTELADEKTLVAIKESSGDVRRITDLFNAVGDRYAIFCGVDDLILESVMLGATGWVAGLSLAFPHENQHLWELMTRGQWDEARNLYRWYMPLLHLDTHVKFVQYIKLAVQECGFGSEWVRAPRLHLAEDEREQVLAVIRKGIETRPALPRRHGHLNGEPGEARHGRR